MDFHILIVISCVFLFSLLSLLLINRFFRRKTFEEVVAEKRALSEKIFGQQRAPKKPKILHVKKIMKRDKKQKQKTSKSTDTTHSDDSEAQSDNYGPGLSKTHVEFEPEPEVVTFVSDTLPSVPMPKLNVKKNKKNEKKQGILVNKNEPVAIKDSPIVEEANNFEAKQPKDVLELKKAETKKEEAIIKAVANKKGKENKKDKLATVITTPTTSGVPAVPAVPINNQSAVVEPKIELKEIKQQQEEKVVRHTSPKNANNKSKQQNKKQNKETAATKELAQALDKLSENDSISVQLLMNLFRRAELNRSEIQILIDYLLNRQQDRPTSHSEWSDDQCQKLKRQLEEKERALIEEQEASIGIQAKLRELRTEINTERLQMAATIKAYTEKLQAKEQEIVGLSQEVQSLNDKLVAERQQFQNKLLREKQSSNQDLLGQLQLMQNEMAHKDKCINELTCLVNASRQSVEEAQQKNDIMQQQTQQIRALEQQRDELEQLSNNQIFELEKLKTLETENAELKVELCNLQNALESAKADLAQACQETESLKAKLAHLHNDTQQDIQNMQLKNTELTQQLTAYSNQSMEQSKEHSDLHAILNQLKAQLTEKERLLSEFNSKHAELLQRCQHMTSSTQQQSMQQQELQQHVETLQADVSLKSQQLEDMEQRSQQLNSREKELLQQLHEQKEKNNQQQQLLSAIQKPASIILDNASLTAKIRSFYERLYPEAVKDCANIALSASLETWVEHVLNAHIKHKLNNSVLPNPTTAIATTNTVALSSSHKATQSNNNSSSNNNNGTSNGSAASHEPHNEENLPHNNNNSNISSSSNSSNDSQMNNNNNSSNLVTTDNKNDTEVEQLQVQNAQLRAQISELTKLVKKTSNTLSDLETRAREQEEHWRSVVRSQEEKIQLMQHSNGE